MTSKADKYKLYEANALLGYGFLCSLQAFPEAKALHIDNKYYTYSELYELALPFSSKLIKEQIHTVGVLCKNELSSYVNILAAAISGVCYVPLNTKFPIERLKKIIADCRLTHIIDENGFNKELSHNVRSEIDHKENDTAYIIYTSGSTGVPKGVGISRKNINSFFNYYKSNFNFNSNDRFLQPYELSFDVSVFSVFCAWNAGACVYAVSDNGIKYIEILKALQENKITVCSMVPSILKLTMPYLKDIVLPELKYSFFSGDALYHSDAVKWKQCIPNASVYNFYGPTETTIVCTVYEWKENISAIESCNNIVPIGKPFHGNKFHIIDEHNNIIENYDEVGELCFSGIQIIESYLNEKSPNSFLKINNKIFYKTGDLASINTNSNLIFHGRKDTQVKINGYRIELLEVENMISQKLNCNCKVICEEHHNGNRMIAFIEKKAISKEELKLNLQNALPEYMIPSGFYFVHTFPKNINDKLDLEKLKSLGHG